MSQEDEIKRSLDLIQSAVIALDKKIEAQNHRITRIEQHADSADFMKSTSQEEQSAAPLSQAEASYGAEVHELLENNNKSIEEFQIENNKNSNEKSLEENIGGTWFMRIGITALVLGISFFLKYAFDNDWIGETGRVMIGIFIGLGMLSFGEKTIRKYVMYGQMMTGAGIAVLYLSIFSAFNYYHIIGSFTAFFAMLIITAAGIILSLRYDAISLMMVALIGGFATPLMASSGQNNQFGLLSYVALLDMAILAVSIFKKWREVNVAGFMGTVILFSAWAEKFYTKNDLNSTMFFLTLFFVIYSISSLIYNLVKKEKSTGVEQILTLISAVIYFSASYALLNEKYHVLMGFFAIVLAIYYFLWAFVVRNFTPEDENLYGFLAFLTVGFVTLALPIQFKQNVITIGWIIEAVLLMIIGMKLKKNVIVIFSIVVSALALFRYLVFDVSRLDKYSVTVFNSAFFTAIMLIVALYLIGYIVKIFSNQEDTVINKKSIFALFMITANLVTIFAISREVTTSYERDINAIYAKQSEAQSFLYDSGAQSGMNSYYNSSAFKLNQSKIEKLQNKSSISLSIFWLIYAIILLAVGVMGKYKSVRVGGLMLLLLAIIKLFFIDLWSLGTLYRIISSMSLGVVLLAISFVYQKYKNTIKEII
jgi:uncharacterized membrane protein